MLYNFLFRVLWTTSLPFVVIGKRFFDLQVTLILVTLVLLSSVFASTVNAILIGLVLCTFSTLMLLLIKCKTTYGLVLWGVLSECVQGWGSDQDKQHIKIKDLNMKTMQCVCSIQCQWKVCQKFFNVYDCASSRLSHWVAAGLCSSNTKKTGSQSTRTSLLIDCNIFRH